MDYIVPCLKFLTMSPFSHNHKASTVSEQKHFPFVNMLKPDFFFLYNQRVQGEKLG